MANKLASIHRRPHEIAIIFIALCAVYSVISYEIQGPGVLWSVVAFALLCALIDVRPKLLAFALAPLVLIPTSLFTVATALIAALLLSAGPYIVHLPILLVEFYISEVRKDDRSNLAKVAFARMISGPIRGLISIALLIFTHAESGLRGMLLLSIPAILFWKSRYKFACVVAVAASAVMGWATGPLLFASLAFLIEAARWTARPPQRSLRFPRPSIFMEPRTWLAVVRCDAYLRRSDLIRARKILLRDGRSANNYRHLRLVHLDLEERAYQSGLSCRELLSTASVTMRPFWQIHYGRALSGTAQFELARTAYDELLSSETLPNDLYTTVSLFAAENDLAVGDYTAARSSVEGLRPSLTGGRRYLDRLRSCRILSEAALGLADQEGAKTWLDQATNDLLGNRWTRRLVTGAKQDRTVRLLFGSQGSAYVQMVQFDILERRAAIAAGTAERPDFELGPYALAMSLAHCWDDLIDLLLGEAEITARTGEYAEACELGARALMELDRTRYSLAAQSARTSWSRRLQRGLAITLDSAYQQDDTRLLAELIEFARVQTLPAANGEMVEDLALATPPIVKVRSQSRLARPGLARPMPVDIEHAAVRAAGQGAWWLSFWEAGDWLYWSLIPSVGRIQGGRHAIAPGTDLSDRLRALRECLPILLPGEDAATADFRISASPLLTDLEQEIRLSNALGSVLLPGELLVAAKRHMQATGVRLPLAIAPAASLGYVPWSLLATDVNGIGDPLDPDRLLDLCDWVLAPSAALLLHAHQPAMATAPLTVAIVDTCTTAELGALPEARQQAQALPASVAVLGGRHWTGAVATLPALEAELRLQRGPFTAAFICHAVRGSAEEPSTGGLVMVSNAEATGESIRPSTEIAILQPSEILAMARRQTPMPTQVVLQACDTSALSDTTSGEWLTIAPAFIAAGCREVISTLYPLPDQTDPNDALILAALNGTSLCEAMRKQQRQGLVRWRSGQVSAITHTPLTWAAYAPICSRTADATNSVKPVSSHDLVSTRLIRVIGYAVKECLEARAKRLDTGYILSAYLQESGIADDFDGANNSLRPYAFLWSLGPYILSRFLRVRDRNLQRLKLHDGPRIFVPFILIEAIKEASKRAALDGSLIQPEHVVKYLLERPSAARRILILLSRISRKRPELMVRAVDHELADAMAKSSGSQPTNIMPGSGSARVSAMERQNFTFAIVELALKDNGSPP